MHIRKFLVSTFFLLAALFVNFPAHALVQVKGPFKILVYTQSTSNSSTANFIEIQGGTLTNCPYNRAYISVSDKELYARALSAQQSNYAITIAYEDSAPSVIAPPHGLGKCKVISIW